MEKYGKEYNRKVQEVSPSAFNFLLQYNWPGNVRELEHVMEHALLMTKGDTIHKESLPEKILTNLMLKADESFFPEGGLNLKGSLEQFEKQTIEKALNRKTKGEKEKRHD